jgi:hypothetical protein
MSLLPSQAHRAATDAKLTSDVVNRRVRAGVRSVGAAMVRWKWSPPVFLHAWWFLLGGSYIWQFWGSPAVSGVDASGHVAALHLYATHVYPHVQGWIPEFFGGMPFPVFYPPIFY